MSSAREEQARAALTPLGDREWPVPLLAAIAVAVAVAIAVLVGALTSEDLASRGGSLPGGIFIALLLVTLAVNMIRRRYWAVLAFEALLAFQIAIATLGLVVAQSLLAAGLCIAAIALGGWLFWKLVRVMGRIQAGQLGERDA